MTAHIMPGLQTPEQQWNNRSSSLKKARAKKIKSQSNNGVRGQKTSNGRESAPSPSLIRNKHRIVPPVSRADTTADDSWGEHSEGSDVDDYITQRSHSQLPHQPSQAYPLPPMSFALVPVQYPGSLGYQHPPQPTPRRKPNPVTRKKPTQTLKKKRTETIGTNTNEIIILPEEQRDVTVDTADLNADSFQAQPRTAPVEPAIQSHARLSGRNFGAQTEKREPPAYERRRAYYEPDPQYIDPQYQYISVSQQPDDYHVSSRTRQGRLLAIPEGPIPEQEVLDWATLEAYENKRFGESITQNLVDATLDEFIPDVLIEALEDMMPQSARLSFETEPHKSHVAPLHNQSYNSSTLQYRPEAHPRTTVSKPRQPEFQSIESLEKLSFRPTEVAQGGALLGLLSEATISKELLAGILNEVVVNESLAVVRDTCTSVVRELLDEVKAQQEFGDMVDDVVLQNTQDMFAEILNEVADELMIEENLINPVVTEMATRIATETLQQATDRVKLQQYNAVSSATSGKFLDGQMLHYFLTQIVRQGQSFPHDGNVLLDSMMLDILLRRLAEMNISLDSGLTLKPTRRLHQRIFTDIALDILLNEMSLSLDEDMKDYDEYETGLALYLPQKSTS